MPLTLQRCNLPQRAAVICPVHGFRPLARQEYLHALGCETPWECPLCARPGQFVSYDLGSFGRGCTVCGLELAIGKAVFDEDFLAFFCDPLCHAVYLSRFEEEKAKWRLRAKNPGSN